ncbi:MAG TPA: NCS1 family nucleobase:cation symporter-1 [Rhizomicrobium sp.]|nr:NCS1 family nucleobase:cation symporter-1 [Rhizomicrobium sp.]
MSIKPDGADADLWNDDLAPTTPHQRNWSWKNFSALWVGMVACIPTYMLASGLISSGLSPAQAILLVFAGNVIVLIPMLLTGAMGTAYGIPFPVLLRSSFGPRGAQAAALARAFVACGWFGINTWIGGSAIYGVVNLLTHNALAGAVLPVLGINAGQTLCFVLFWAVHVYFISHGTESIRWLETLAAPFLLAMGLVLLGWAYVNAHGFGAMLGAPSAFGPGSGKEALFWPTVIASLTAMVGFWATLSLNICDFTRFSRSQKDQILGQSIGLPLPMALVSFISVAVTGATVVIFGKAIWEPTELAAHLGGIGAVLALVVICLCTLTVNMAANVVSPSYDFSNLAPAKISFTGGGYITAAIGLLIFPWRLLESAGTYIFAWLVGYSALLGPIAGIMIADYFIVRRRALDVPDLFRHGGRYDGSSGWNLKGILALALGVAPNLPGFLHSVKLVDAVPPLFDTIFTGAWFFGFFISAGVYVVLNGRNKGT